MTNAETKFHQIVEKLPNATKSKMFGAWCIKAPNGKSSAIFWKNDMIFKLDSESEKLALNLQGARQGTHLYAPDRPMKGWVLIPYIHSDEWIKFAEKSIEYAQNSEK